jgi:hypothetical protein
VFPELADVVGQPLACWALGAAAFLSLTGPPGRGKTMLANAAGLLPPTDARYSGRHIRDADSSSTAVPGATVLRCITQSRRDGRQRR